MDGVADFEERGCRVGTRHSRATLQGRNLTDLIVGGRIYSRLRLRARRQRPKHRSAKKCDDLAPLHCAVYS